MASFVLAAAPVLSWEILSSAFTLGRVRAQSDSGYILDHEISGLPVTVELYGTGFGTGGAGLRSGTAQVNTLQYTVSGQVVMRLDDTILTGSTLSNLMKGLIINFKLAVLGGNDVIVLSNGADYQEGYGGNDVIYGRGGDDTLHGTFGNDTLFGGEGNDRFTGGDGSDLVVGGWGDDTAYGGIGAELGGAGTDVFLTGALRRQAQVAASTSTVNAVGFRRAGHPGRLRTDRLRRWCPAL